MRWLLLLSTLDRTGERLAWADLAGLEGLEGQQGPTAVPGRRLVDVAIGALPDLRSAGRSTPGAPRALGALGAPSGGARLANDGVALGHGACRAGSDHVPSPVQPRKWVPLRLTLPHLGHRRSRSQIKMALRDHLAARRSSPPAALLDSGSQLRWRKDPVTSTPAGAADRLVPSRLLPGRGRLSAADTPSDGDPAGAAPGRPGAGRQGPGRRQGARARGGRAGARLEPDRLPDADRRQAVPHLRHPHPPAAQAARHRARPPRAGAGAQPDQGAARG